MKFWCGTWRSVGFGNKKDLEMKFNNIKNVNQYVKEKFGLFGHTAAQNMETMLPNIESLSSLRKVKH